jgi:hypothetical protein
VSNRAAALAALIVFTTPPSDRALAGWYLDRGWLAEELDAFGLRERVA